MLTVTQRLKGAIDSRIAEEQARQRQVAEQSRSQTPGRSNSVRRSNSRALSPGRRPARPRTPDLGDKPNAKGPDPAEFDPEFVVGEDEMSRSTTPKPADDKDETAQAAAPTENGNVSKGEQESSDSKQYVGGSAASAELPMETRMRLRKLEKLEPKYSELLRSYRIAHARVTAIEPFEAALREHTPLTSVNDPGALVEYLDQIKLKGDMVMEELKRLSAERDSLKQNLDDAEKRAAQAQEEIATFRSGITSVPAEQAAGKVDADSKTKDIHEHKDSKDASEETEEFFSYDSELPRVQKVLHEKEDQVAALEIENQALKKELSSAKESAEQLVQNLETSTRDMQSLRDTKERFEKDSAEQARSLENQVEELTTKLEQAQRQLEEAEKARKSQETSDSDFTSRIEAANKELEESRKTSSVRLEDDKESRRLKGQVDELECELADLRKSQSEARARTETLNNLVETLKLQLKQVENENARLSKASDNKNSSSKTEEVPTASDKAPAPTAASAGAAKKKNNKKKKKGGKGGAGGGAATSQMPERSGTPAPSETTLVAAPDETAEVGEDLETALRATLEETQKSLTEREEEVALQEELDELRHELVEVGQGHVEAKEKLKELQAEKGIAELKTSHERQALAEDFENAAQHLAAQRFKDLSDLREVLQKAQPELNSLRKEEELGNKASEVRKLEARERELRSEIATDSEVRTLKNMALDQTCSKAQRDLERTEGERAEAVEARDRQARDLSKMREELKTSQANAKDLEHQLEKLNGELKSAQYASAQSLMNSMQDQTQEIGTQMKEVRERYAHRLLSERSREGETMRRLLADVESRAEARVKEMRERMDVAIEERDRAEDQANTIGRRRARELEDAKQNRTQEEKEDLARQEREVRKQKEELERKAAHAGEEVAELRDALDEGERQTRELEREKMELRRSLEEAQKRKSLAEELRGAQAKAKSPTQSGEQSSRSSVESAARGRVASPIMAKGRSPSIATESGMDVVYLKNVLLQFLEQKDKKHQMQLVPVLGMLLNFDRKDEQKWMSVITGR
ncbi:leucine zipper protein 1 [Phyllosticta citricarpa]